MIKTTDENLIEAYFYINIANETFYQTNKKVYTYNNHQYLVQSIKS